MQGLTLIETTHVTLPARITREQAAELLNVSVKTLASQSMREKLPYVEPAKGCGFYLATHVQDVMLRSLKGGWAVAKIDTLRELERARIRVAELEAKTKELDFQLEVARRAK